MNKVIVIGCPGAGKSTFSRALHEISGLPLYHLDMLYWKPDKTYISKELFRERLREIISTDKWIIDGNYGSTIEMRLRECDTVFFLDFPVEVCLQGINDRKGKPRPDMPWTETEDDGEFIEFIKNFNTHSKPKILELMEIYSDKNVIIFKNREELNAYLNKIQ